MSQDYSTVVRRQVELTNSYGLHLGPAGKFVKLASRFQSEVRVIHNGNEINGKSILDLTLLAAECGTKLDIEARGPDAGEAIEALSKLVADQFHDEADGLRDPAP
jgi:phosphocarrier protein